jgi:hypothetical protein
MGSNPAGDMIIFCCVLYSKDKGTRQDNEDKATIRRKVQRETKRRNSEKKIPVGTRFPTPVCRVALGVIPRVKRWGVALNNSSSAEVKERVELYLCSPSGPSWPS